MQKYLLLQEVLLSEKVAVPSQFLRADKAPRSVLEKVHDILYLDDFEDGVLDKRMLQRIGLPWSQDLVERTYASAGGTMLAGRLALESGIACYLGGGTHHAFPDRGAGFCILNDVSVAVRQLLSEGLVSRVLIVDLDVHQGDGTAWIHRNEPEVFTFSMHCETNFPFHKQQSDLDLPLVEGMEDREYLRILSGHLPDLLDSHHPDIVFYNAGCDPHRDDMLGLLSLSSNGIYERDRYVIDAILSAGLPIACVLGGGYSADHDELSRRHTIAIKAASAVFREHGQ